MVYVFAVIALCFMHNNSFVSFGLKFYGCHLINAKKNILCSIHLLHYSLIIILQVGSQWGNVTSVRRGATYYRNIFSVN
jgi:hypothetical protein